jgi:hypothetical protein
MVTIAVVVDSGGGGIEPTAPMAALSTVVAVNGSGDNGVFTNASHNKDRHLCPHHPRPCPPLDKEWMAGWIAAQLQWAMVANAQWMAVWQHDQDG